MSVLKAIEELIRKTEKLTVFDDDQLDAIKRQGTLIIRKTFGTDSHYLHDLEDIRFYPMAGVVGQQYPDFWRNGKTKLTNFFRTLKEDIEWPESSGSTSLIHKNQLSSTNKIFVVHGHDEEVKQAVARTLETLGLEPIILHEQPDKGRTIIEKFSDYAEISSFAVVLLSPDDLAFPKNEEPENVRPRARQNVILELGFFLGKLGRDRVLVLYKETPDFDMPSDYAGVLYIPYDSGGRWRYGLGRELGEAGYIVDLNRLR
jgi:predicted nucleotide-binding protein